MSGALRSARKVDLGGARYQTARGQMGARLHGLVFFFNRGRCANFSVADSRVWSRSQHVADVHSILARVAQD
eukprot:3691291-Lingulodinium_polyedra.AAC.1